MKNRHNKLQIELFDEHGHLSCLSHTILSIVAHISFGLKHAYNL